MVPLYIERNCLSLDYVVVLIKTEGTFRAYGGDKDGISRSSLVFKGLSGYDNGCASVGNARIRRGNECLER